MLFRQNPQKMNLRILQLLQVIANKSTFLKAIFIITVFFMLPFCLSNLKTIF